MIAKNHNKFTLAWILSAIFIVHISVIFNDFHADDFEILIIMDNGFDLQAFKSMENPQIFRPFTNLVLYLAGISISYILFDFKTGMPIVKEKFDGNKLIE
ncbi:MAG: hypothetical protein J7K40_04865 [candidate division Zixibacteria bacterium]|nr:hypothetical protein [candidate division Zixibacteria bacterium]